MWSLLDSIPAWYTTPEARRRLVDGALSEIQRQSGSCGEENLGDLCADPLPCRSPTDGSPVGSFGNTRISTLDDTYRKFDFVRRHMTRVVVLSAIDNDNSLGGTCRHETRSTLLVVPTCVQHVLIALPYTSYLAVKAPLLECQLPPVAGRRTPGAYTASVCSQIKVKRTKTAVKRDQSY